MNGIIWLASFPKSGNTWFRIFLHNLHEPDEAPIDINALGFPVISLRNLFERAVGVEASDLTPDEVTRMRAPACAVMARRARGALLFKIHDAYRPTDDAQPVVSTEVTSGAIYLIRNPLDVAVSWAHHRRISIAGAVDELCDPAMKLSGDTGRLSTQLRQIVRDWSGHVRSWLEAPFPVHVVRYEDLLDRPVETFEAAVRFIGWPHDRAAVEQAERHSRFDVLASQERKAAFREKSPRTQRFFRKGQRGGWRTVLTAEQVQRVVTAHGDMMRRFGYLPDDCPRL